MCLCGELAELVAKLADIVEQNYHTSRVRGDYEMLRVRDAARALAAEIARESVKVEGKKE